MGITFSKLFARLFSKKEMRILMVSSHPRVPHPPCAQQHGRSAATYGIWWAAPARMPPDTRKANLDEILTQLEPELQLLSDSCCITWLDGTQQPRMPARLCSSWPRS